MGLLISAPAAGLNTMINYSPRTGPWNLSDIKQIPNNGRTVFSCFHCGGGSTMGYKLAGYTVLGGVEIDPDMMSLYRKNHSPLISYLMGVQEFKNIPDEQIPKELFQIDILDGSPPCSSFSLSGNREKNWGEKKKFREGQAEQVLDDLFFDFIDIAVKLKPKIVVAENVRGLIAGAARGYVKQIFQAFEKAGYRCQLFLFSAATMGVPQKRERVFFIASRNDLEFKPIKLQFEEKPISVKKAFHGIPEGLPVRKLSDESHRLWGEVLPGDRFSSATGGSRFNDWKLPINAPAGTITANGTILHPIEPRHLNDIEYARLQSFPDDYDFMNQKAQYVCGMSVPPFMLQRIADQIHKQWLDHG